MSYQHHHTLSSFDLTTLDIENGGSSSTPTSDSNYFEGLPILAALRSSESAKDVQYWTSSGPQYSAHSPSGSSGGIANLFKWIQAGLVDSIRFKEVAAVVGASSAVRISIAKGLVLSVAVVIVIFFFELAFFPAQLYPGSAGEEEQRLTNGNTLWLYPVIAISYFVASSWTLDVAKTAYKLRHSHLRGLSLANFTPAASSSLRRRICQESFRVLLILNYIAIVLALQRLPYSSYLGRTAGFLFMSFVDAFYCFDPVLTSRGWSVERRMRFVEEKWAYMTAFGLLPTLVSFFHPSGLLNLFLFMLVYPFYTVLALMAHPQPRGSTSPSAGAFVPRRLPFFFPTAIAYRWIMKFAPPATRDDGPLGYGGISRSGSGATLFDSKNSGTAAPAWNSYHGNHGSSAPERKTAAQFVGGVWGQNGAAYNGSRWGATPPSASPHLGGASHLNGTYTPTSAQAQELTIPVTYSHTTQLNAVNAGNRSAAVVDATTPSSSALSSIPLSSHPSSAIPPPPKGNARTGKKVD